MEKAQSASIDIKHLEKAYADLKHHTRIYWQTCIGAVIVVVSSGLYFDNSILRVLVASVILVVVWMYILETVIGPRKVKAVYAAMNKEEQPGDVFVARIFSAQKACREASETLKKVRG